MYPRYSHSFLQKRAERTPTRKGDVEQVNMRKQQPSFRNKKFLGFSKINFMPIVYWKQTHKFRFTFRK